MLPQIRYEAKCRSRLSVSGFRNSKPFPPLRLQKKPRQDKCWNCQVAKLTRGASTRYCDGGDQLTQARGAGTNPSFRACGSSIPVVAKPIPYNEAFIAQLQLRRPGDKECCSNRLTVLRRPHMACGQPRIMREAFHVTTWSMDGVARTTSCMHFLLISLAFSASFLRSMLLSIHKSFLRN
jgi:hypothetical protein